MLDIEERNIGATVSLAQKLSKDAPDVGKHFDDLFDIESTRCSFKREDRCGYFSLFEPSEDRKVTCNVSECPLGHLVDVELMGTYIGPCSSCDVPVHASNLGHVDDHIQMCKSCFEAKGL